MDRFLVDAAGSVVEIDVSARGDKFGHLASARWNSARHTAGRSPQLAVTVRATPLDDDVALSMLAEEVTDAVIRRQDHEGLWLLRSTAFSGVSGNVVAFCATDDDGSSARVLEVLGSRYAYVTDTMIGVDPQAGVASYRRPFAAARDRVPPVLDGAPVSPDDGGAASAATLRLARVVFLVCADDVEEPSVEVLDMPSAIELLIKQVPGLGGMRNPLRAICAVLESTGGLALVRYRTDADLSRVLDEFMSIPPPALVSEHSLGSTDSTPFVAPDPLVEGALYRGAASDHVLLGDGRVALLDLQSEEPTVKILSANQTAIWLAAEGVPPETLQRASAVACGGDQGDANEDLVSAELVSGLEAAGVLSREPSWRVNNDAVWSESTGRSIVFTLSVQNSQPVALEASAHMVWTVLAKGLVLPQSEIVRECARRVGFEPGEISADIIQLLRELQRLGIVSVL